MRILHVLPSYDLGGLGSLALELIRAWDQSDDCAVIAPRYPATVPALKSEFEALDIKALEIERPRDHMAYVAHLQWAIRTIGDFDGAIIYNVFDHVWTTMALKRAGVRPPKRILAHVGTILPDAEHPRAMFKSPYTQGVTFIPASAAVHNRLVALGVRPEALGPIIWNGVDLDNFWPRKPKAAEAASISIGFIGRMAPEAKDFPTLIKAMGLLNAEAKSKCKLLLVGDGPLQPEYFKLGQQMAPGQVEFLGPMKPAQVRRFLSDLDFFVMAALPIEGMSMALVEAIAAGLPIIATDVPGNREVVDEHGLLTKPGDPVDMARAIEGLVLDEDRRAYFAELSAARRREFSIEITARHYRELLQEGQDALRI